MKLRFIQWNIKHNSNPESIADFILENLSDVTIVHLQEVTVTHYKIIQSKLGSLNSAHSLTLRPKGRFEGKNRELGVATFIFGGILLSSDLLHRSVFPERTLIAEIQIADRVFKSLNFHSLTGVGYRQAKSSNFSSIADYLNASPVDLFSCDANEPNVDALSIEELVFFDNGDKGKCASLIFGKDKVHELSDVWRTHFELKANEQVAMLDAPQLPISYVINNRLLKRYDFIFATAAWKPLDVQYLLKESLAASSDHAMVIADLMSV